MGWCTIKKSDSQKRVLSHLSKLWYFHPNIPPPLIRIPSPSSLLSSFPLSLPSRAKSLSLLRELVLFPLVNSWRGRTLELNMRAFSWGGSQGRWDYSSVFLSWLCLLAQIDSTSHLKSFLSTGFLSSRRFPSSIDDTVIHNWINKKIHYF